MAVRINCSPIIFFWIACGLYITFGSHAAQADSIVANNVSASGSVASLYGTVSTPWSDTFASLFKTPKIRARVENLIYYAREFQELLEEEAAIYDTVTMFRGPKTHTNLRLVKQNPLSAFVRQNTH